MDLNVQTWVIPTVQLVCKAKIWLVGCDSWLAVLMPADTSFTSEVIPASLAIARAVQQADKRRKPARYVTQNQKSLLRRLEFDSRHSERGGRCGYSAVPENGL